MSLSCQCALVGVWAKTYPSAGFLQTFGIFMYISTLRFQSFLVLTFALHFAGGQFFDQTQVLGRASINHPLENGIRI